MDLGVKAVVVEEAMEFFSSIFGWCSHCYLVDINVYASVYGLKSWVRGGFKCQGSRSHTALASWFNCDRVDGEFS